MGFLPPLTRERRRYFPTTLNPQEKGGFSGGTLENVTYLARKLWGYKVWCLTRASIQAPRQKQEGAARGRVEGSSGSKQRSAAGQGAPPHCWLPNLTRARAGEGKIYFFNQVQRKHFEY